MKVAVLIIVSLGLLVLLISILRRPISAIESSEHDARGDDPRAPDWINVRVGSPGGVREAVESYSQLSADRESREVTVVITTIRDGTVGVTFSEKLPPYTFLNLLGWLHAPPGVEGVTGAFGWYSSPASAVRFTFWPDESNPHGDTLIGVSSRGESVSVYQPDISFCRTTQPLARHPEPDPQPVERVGQLQLRVPVEVMADFGNPTLEFTHSTDTTWN